MKISRIATSLCLIALVVLSACRPKDTEAPDSSTPEFSMDLEGFVHDYAIIVGAPQEPTVLNPLLASTPIEDAVSALIVEGLVQVDAEGHDVAVLAQELPTYDEETQTLMYKLREGVQFSNGDTFTCADVVYTYEAILSPRSTVSTSGYHAIEAVECVDEYTVKVSMAATYAPYLRLFSHIIPQAAGDVAAMDQWDYNRAPIGTGPWQVETWQAGEYIRLIPNPHYREVGEPYLDQVVVYVLPSYDVGMQLLGTGDIDVLWGLFEADIAELEAMAAQGVRWTAAPTGEHEMLVFNLGDPAGAAPADPTEAPHPILSDPRVREAIELAIDPQLIVDALLFGHVQASTSVLASGKYGCAIAPPPYNPTRAAELLEAAGWIDADGDGYREKAGRPLELRITSTAGHPLREATEQILAEMLQTVGIRLTIDNVPPDELFAGWDAGGLRPRGTFDILLYTGGPYPFSPDQHLYTNYHATQIPTGANGGTGANYSRWRNADVDTWLADAASTTDETARHAYFCKIAQTIRQERPRLYLYERLHVSGYRERLQNLRVSPGFADFAVDSQEWYIAP